MALRTVLVTGMSGLIGVALRRDLEHARAVLGFEPRNRVEDHR
jgi:hypothetical protein